MPVFIVAEAGSNWRVGSPSRDREMAKRLIEFAAEAKADAVKFQTFRPETLYVANAGSPSYLEGLRMHDLFRDLSMPYEMHEELAAYSERCGIEWMSTPFSLEDFKAVDPFVKRHKIASYEISHVRLIEAAAKSGKPLILSTGASLPEDIEWAVSYFKEKGGKELSLMQCTLSYPTPPQDVNLNVIPLLRERYGVPVGLSDHSRSPLEAPLGAVALGATVIEKHFTLHNSLPGPDHHFAITPSELGSLVKSVRLLELMLGEQKKSIAPSEEEMYNFGRRGVQAIKPIKQGDLFHEGVNIAILRPGQQERGVHPKYLDNLEGAKALRSIGEGEGIQLGDWEGA